ncbi:response regulator transcription factor [Saccharopolyspora indica]|uniref:response regulator transcription factor n=1 Tax=Saccharopolyspora indica TaxID=1229659 RepID=UPI0022EA678F|nr:response regulator transcription factor [Saccharopolyspora indica]MDA3644257.1 response regulator transcription factor [Saccharopolyspora indica]
MHHEPVIGVELRELCADVRAALDLDIALPDVETVSPDLLKPVLSRLWFAVLGGILRAEGGAAEGRRLLELLGRIRDAESAVAEARVVRRHAVLREVADALAWVRGAGTADDFLRRVPEAGCRLGFDRVLVSRVEDSVWKLHSMCVVREQERADELVAVGRASPPLLEGDIVEADVVNRSQSCLVFDVQNSHRVVRDLVRVGRSESYGVAPLAVHGEVVGMIHADRYYQRRDVDTTDQTLLSLMAEGLSDSLGRLVLLEGLAALHRGAGLPVASTAPAPQPDEVPLTPRESEVMELLAAGTSNRQIARKLLITEGTVKAHVTRILRKLDVTSRTEAISRWLRNRPAYRGYPSKVERRP